MDNTSDTVNLIDTLKMLVKNKNAILFCFLAGILFAAGFILLTPKIYRSEATIEIGQIDKGYGEMTFTKNAGDLAAEINSSFIQKYPLLTAISPANGLVKINNYSADKNEAQKGVLDVVTTTLSQDSNFNDKIQAQLKQLQATKNTLKAEGQQVVNIELKLFDLQNQLNNFVPSKIVEPPMVFSEKKSNPVFYVIIGGLFGFFMGLIFVAVKEWWEKNKKYVW